VSVFKYRAVIDREEEFTEEGTVLAKDESEAKEKLRILRYRTVHVKRLSGISAFLKQFSADVR
jgi:hypothetical protein